MGVLISGLVWGFVVAVKGESLMENTKTAKDAWASLGCWMLVARKFNDVDTSAEAQTK